MSRRSGMSRSHSKAVFRKGARNVHPKNLRSNPMRGGIRL